MRTFCLTAILSLLTSAASAAALTTESANKLMMKSGCMTCHSIDNTKIGPAYKDVSARYNNPNAETLAYLKGERPADYLMKKVRTGTKVGVNKNWIKSKEGKTYGMMTPNPVGRISDADLKDLVTFILTLK
jgi:cytochrome c